jgi:ABC-type multidrug transport system fused ATPase/permease subunit
VSAVAESLFKRLVPPPPKRATRSFALMRSAGTWKNIPVEGGLRFASIRLAYGSRTSWCCANCHQTLRSVAPLILVAGPNGSGKSTLSAAIAEGATVVVDPDAVAGQLTPSSLPAL